jgi:hypothetical protein
MLDADLYRYTEAGAWLYAGLGVAAGLLMLYCAVIHPEWERRKRKRQTREPVAAGHWYDLETGEWVDDDGVGVGV